MSLLLSESPVRGRTGGVVCSAYAASRPR